MRMVASVPTRALARRHTTSRIAADFNQAGLPLYAAHIGIETPSDVAEIPSWLNRMLSLPSLPEPMLLRYDINLPFGGLVLAAGRKGP
jgi:hypothetical protein